MKTLKLIGQCLTVLGMCSKTKNMPYAIFINWTTLCVLIGHLMITLQFILSHFDDTAELLYGIMQFVTFVTVSSSYYCFAMEKTAIFHFIKEMQLIVDDYKQRTESYGIYLDAESKAHAITKWPPILLFAVFYGVMVATVLFIIISDVIPGELHPETWYTFYKMTAPFDRNTVFGFIMYFIIQFFVMHCYWAGLFPCFSFYVATCAYFDACCLDLAEQFESIDSDIRLSNLKEIDAKIKLTSIVRFHMKIVEQFKLSASIFSGVIFSQLFFGSAFISTTVFQLNLAWGTFDVNFVVIFSVFILSILSVLPYCWFATNLSLKLQNIGDDAYNALWYRHPYKMQMYTQQIITYAQIRRSYEGYQFFHCSLDIFVKITKASSSYYLMFKSL